MFSDGSFEVRTVYVSLPTVMIVKNFVESISSLEGDFDLLDGKFIMDARSLMGIFGLNLSEPVKLRIEKDTDATMQAIASFIADERICNCDEL